MSTRIYMISFSPSGNGDDCSIYLVRAKTRTQAMRHVVAQLMACSVATQEELVEHAASVPVEDAVLDPDQQELPLDKQDKAAA